MDITIENRIWIEKNGKPYLGQGRIRLLETIKESGSISKAAAELNMSYKKAWHLVKSMNNLSDKPLVIKESGGKNGGGTKLTVAGEKAILEYRILENKSKAFFETHSTQLNI